MTDVNKGGPILSSILGTRDQVKQFEIFVKSLIITDSSTFREYITDQTSLKTDSSKVFNKIKWECSKETLQFPPEV